MPREFYGKEKAPCGYTISNPRSWTDEEIAWVKERLDEGHSFEEIGEAIGRTSISVSTKIKKQNKTDDLYNKKNRAIKYEANDLFMQQIAPKSVLDLYAGNSYYKDKNLKLLVTNDKDPRFATDHNEDALKLLCKMYAEDKRFEAIDLDPYGSAYECIDLAIKMSRKGLIVSFGEWGHRRWKRYDFVRSRYGIHSADEFEESKFIEAVQRLGEQNKKQLTPIRTIKYDNFLRVYFAIEKKRVTEQWEKQ
jgi:tRNA G26 N,N-dimethylase Trm1